MNQTYGTITATGAAISIDCGFQPDEVQIYNLTNANLSFLHWIKGMAADAGFATTSGTRTKISSNGITVKGAGSADAFAGFVLAAAATVNNTGDTLAYVARRTGLGSGR